MLRRTMYIGITEAQQLSQQTHFIDYLVDMTFCDDTIDIQICY